MITERIRVIKKTLPSIVESLQLMIQYCTILEQDIDKEQKEHDELSARINAMHDEEKAIDQKRLDLSNLEAYKTTLDDFKRTLDSERVLIDKEKQAAREKQLVLEMKEKRLNEKSQQINSILQE